MATAEVLFIMGVGLHYIKVMFFFSIDKLGVYQCICTKFGSEWNLLGFQLTFRHPNRHIHKSV